MTSLNMKYLKMFLMDKEKLFIKNFHYIIDKNQKFIIFEIYFQQNFNFHTQQNYLNKNILNGLIIN